MTPVRLEPAAPRSRVKHSTTKPKPRISNIITMLTLTRIFHYFISGKRRFPHLHLCILIIYYIHLAHVQYYKELLVILRDVDHSKPDYSKNQSKSNDFVSRPESDF